MNQNVGSFCSALFSISHHIQKQSLLIHYSKSPPSAKVMIEKQKKRGRDPTMEEATDDQKLQQIFKNLEREWDFIKQKPEKTMFRNSTGSSKIIKTLGLLNNNSPRKLMSSLQQRSSSISPPSEGVAWKVRTNDLAVEEILRERRAAIESGKLKGRRLFEEEDDVTEVGFGTNNVTFNPLEIGLVQNSEVRSVFSYESDNYEDDNWGRKETLSPSFPNCAYSSSSSSSSSSLCVDENVQRSRAEMATMADKKIAYDVRNGRVPWIVIKVGVAISLFMFIVSIISRSLNIYEDEEVILTPT